MEQIIDVEYREVSNIEEKTNEELCREVNLYWNQMEALGRLGLEFAANAGKRLVIIKSRLQHGEWEEWCESNLCFSTRKANRMMKLAEKTSDENSLFFKNDNLSDIGISKVWELLSAPEDVAEQVMQNPEITDMTVKELKEEIKRHKTANEEKSVALSQLEAELAAANSKAEEAEKRVAELQQQAEADLPANSEELAKVEKDLADAKKELEKAKEINQKTKATIEKEKAAVAEAARKEAFEEAQKKFDKESELLRTSNQEAAVEIDRLQRLAKNSQNTDLVEFKLKSKQLQVDFNACLASIAAVEQSDKVQADKMRAALKTVMGKLMEEI